MVLIAFSLTRLIFHWRMELSHFSATLALSLLVETQKYLQVCVAGRRRRGVDPYTQRRDASFSSAQP